MVVMQERDLLLLSSGSGSSHKEQNDSETCCCVNELHSGVPVEQRRGSGGAAVPPTQVGGRTRGTKNKKEMARRTPATGNEISFGRTRAGNLGHYPRVPPRLTRRGAGAGRSIYKFQHAGAGAG
ncbi:hypothetical protein DY000_02039136 [Brassica cretica]|uniref:Uncharacterized protein n=1 Tax=Brassica cretica TaxID=69181 RepID=A0ABQ7BHJ8_BRACR|nr:hypothetical protein DY000_02039136 [Brassica cretica]